MARKRASPKPKKNTSIKSPSPRSSLQDTSTSQIEKSKSKSIETPKKKTRKSTSHAMYIGKKTFKISRKIMKEIKRYQLSTENLMPRLPFSRLVREILLERAPGGGRVQERALQALHVATEMYVVEYLEDSYACALHARRSTLTVRDMKLIQHLRRP